jgi:hypothetical protein
LSEAHQDQARIFTRADVLKIARNERRAGFMDGSKTAIEALLEKTGEESSMAEAQQVSSFESLLATGMMDQQFA